jgi:hypothetical protein
MIYFLSMSFVEKKNATSDRKFLARSLSPLLVGRVPVIECSKRGLSGQLPA